MKIWQLLDRPEKWTKRAWARTTQNRCGEQCFEWESYAVCWCLVGAIRRCYKRRSDSAKEVEWRIRDRIGVLSLTMWNDAPERTWEEVYTLCKELDV